MGLETVIFYGLLAIIGWIWLIARAYHKDAKAEREREQALKKFRETKKYY